MCAASKILLCGSLFLWAGTAYGVVAPVVSTLSSISEGSVTPVRLAADQYGNYYVTDPRGGGVLKYNSAGSLLQKITTTSKNIFGVALAQNGDILVCQGTAIAVYSSTGVYKSSFGTFDAANGIAVDDTGAIYVTDSKKNLVTVYNSAFTPVTSFGSTGSAAGQFKQPTGIAYEKVSKQIAVVDTLNGRVQFFTTAGVHQKTVGSFGSGPLKFTSPQAIAFEYSSNGTVLSRIYVVDSFQANVQVIDAASSAFLRYVGSYGLRSGQLVTPGDILLDSFNRLVIPNGTGSLVLFGVESSTSGSSAGGTVIAIPSTGSSAPALAVTTLGTIANTISSVTQNSTVTVSGTTTPGSTVTVNGAAATVDAAGSWTLSVTLTQQGLNNLLVSASNNGSTSAVSAYITLDSAAPVVAASAIPPTGTTTQTPIQTISGTVSDTTATSVTVTVVSGAQTVTQDVPVNAGQFMTAVVLGSGANTITVAAKDAAGLTSSATTSTVTYNPLAPAVSVATPSGSVSGSASYTVTGTVPANSTVTVNGVSAAVSGTQWTADIPLVSGVNPITVTAVTAGNSVVSTASSSVIYAPGQPSLVISSPIADSATAKSSSVITGAVGAGVSVAASLNNVTIPVTVAADGSFSVSLPPFGASGVYTVVVSAIDGNGKISTTARSLVYDPAPAVLTVADASSTSIKVSTSKGVLIAKDKNGLIPAATNGTSSLDLTGATFDLASLNIYALTPAGISSRDGDINGDGKVDIGDALLAAQISLGVAPAATFEQRLRGDVGPLVSHMPVPDGKIRLDDTILILQKAIGIDW